MLRATLSAFALALPVAASAAPETYNLDPHHTYPHFAVEHLGVSLYWARFDRSSGKFTLDRAAHKGTLELAVDTASVSTGDNERGGRPRTLDEHLKSADFFNVAEFPRMTFKSDSVKFAGDSPAEVHGQLTLLGVTKPITLKIERWVCKDHPFSKKPMCGGNASGTLKRSDFGMKYGLAAVSDDVQLYVQFEGYRE
jgi:polyisoprenoid-binding protein YceI